GFGQLLLHVEELAVARLGEPRALPLLKHRELVAGRELDVFQVLAEVGLVLQRDRVLDLDGVRHARLHSTDAGVPATATKSTAFPPLRARNARAASASVAPVVATSSSNSTRRPDRAPGSAAKLSATLARRAASERPVCGGVSRARRSARDAS